jgi:hypothetical protein
MREQQAKRPSASINQYIIAHQRTPTPTAPSSQGPSPMSTQPPIVHPHSSSWDAPSISIGGTGLGEFRVPERHDSVCLAVACALDVFCRSFDSTSTDQVSGKGSLGFVGFPGGAASWKRCVVLRWSKQSLTLCFVLAMFCGAGRVLGGSFRVKTFAGERGQVPAGASG